MGRNKKEIDWSKLDGMLLYDASAWFCAAELGVSHDCLQDRIREEKNMTFSEYKKTKLERTAIRVKQKMITKALSGDNTCMIFVLKNIGDWSDRVDSSGADSSKPIILRYKLEEVSD